MSFDFFTFIACTESILVSYFFIISLQTNYSSPATISVRQGNFQIVSLIAQIIFAAVSLMKPVLTSNAHPGYSSYNQISLITYQGTYLYKILFYLQGPGNTADKTDTQHGHHDGNLRAYSLHAHQIYQVGGGRTNSSCILWTFLYYFVIL